MTSDEAKNLIKKSVLETDANKIDKQSSDTLNQLWRLQGKMTKMKFLLG
jgi:hypothetical protein